MNRSQQLLSAGQSIWYDNISREILDNGELKRIINEWGVRGVTSNPTIFENAFKNGSSYDSAIVELKRQQQSSEQIFESLAVEDIGRAADLLRPIFDSSNGVDGFVSIEVSPLLAADTEGTINEGMRLFKRLNRPNIMIKVPGTKEGLGAVGALLEQGVHVNVTLLFSVDNYIEVASTYCRALTNRLERGEPVNKLRSVASFFVSRVDTIIDNRLNEIAKGSDAALAAQAKGLLGKFGIANCKIAYKAFEEIFNGQSFAKLRTAGALPQRPLWASTSTKNPAYRDVIYCEELIGPETVNTMPHATVAAFVDHGEVRQSLTQAVDEAFQVESDLEDVGVDVIGALEELQVDGVKKFSESFVSLNNTLKEKIAKLYF